MHRWIPTSCVSLTLALSTPAAAQVDPTDVHDDPGASAPDPAEGRRLLAEAEAALRAGDSTRAVLFLRQAYAADPDPRYIANLGVVYEKIGEYAEAERAFRQYVDSDPPADKRLAAEAALNRLRPAGAVVSTPGGARVAVDGTDIGVTPLRTRLLAGARVARFELEGHQPLDAALRIEPGAPFRLEVTLAPVVIDESDLRRTAGYTAIGVGAAALVGAGVLSYLTVQAIDERDAAGSRAAHTTAQDQANVLGVGAIASGVAGLAAVGVGGWLLATLPESASDVALVPGVAGLTIIGRY